MGEWTEQHEQLLAEARPDDSHADSDFDRLWTDVSVHVRTTQHPKRSRRAVVAGACAVLLVVMAGTAAAKVLSSHTGTYDRDEEDRVLGGPGERLDPRGQDFRQVIAEGTVDIPFPTDAARQISLDFQVIDLRDEPSEKPAQVSTSAVAGFVAKDAICSWSNAWARASASGDLAARGRAADALQGAGRWKAVVTLQAIDTDHYDWLPRVQRAALGTSTSALSNALVGKVMCIRALVPDLTDAMPKGLPGCEESVLPRQRAYACPRWLWGLTP